MDDYLAKNVDHWERGYNAPNVDHVAFRLFGRILRPQFGLGKAHERLVDFGCGQGAAVNYFHINGLDAHGVDISNKDISIAKARYPHIANKFSICDPKPQANDFYGFPEDVSVVTAFQALYYFAEADFVVLMDKLYASMNRGAVFFATMMGEQSREYFDNSVPYKDGLRAVNFKSERREVRDYYMFFTKDEDDLKKRFSMFRPVHVGYYAAKFRQDEGDGFHYTFCGIKD